MVKRRHITALFIIGLVMVLIGYFSDKKIQQDLDDDRYRLEVMEDTVNDGWYYEIYFENHLALRQKFIPSISEKRFFITERDAKKTGSLVLERLKSGKSPTISKDDLYKLGITF
ncbi:DUF4907 domain-containing protein [Allomuricauda sp. SCSIO 65647]|uniref:DUF4907 domain-containing protein n=1 Tax=Allomuricauda sp. SCSIO 65647 TaxID=2908843 RepID=UPI001F3FFDFF|nr:DUF4907 domain-containing protein [Muricauda sp. SCSIO 65647]UJH69146.1 DUF4907 domain-containing protein [Muricauda sp. SCSIO 65647]